MLHEERSPGQIPDRTDGEGPTTPITGGAPEGGPKSGAAHRVLLIEDDTDAQDVYRAGLTHAGIEMALARDGEEALRLVESYRPHLIVLDILLPWMDGWDVMLALQRLASGREVPVIVITAAPTDEARQLAAALRCRAFIPKPAAPSALIKVIREVLKGIA